MSWQTVQIKDICKKVTSGGTPLTSKENYYFPRQIPWVKTKEVNYCRITDAETYISKDGLNNSSAKLIPANSVIVAMYGQGDTAGRVAINKIPVATNQACCNLIIDEAKADYRFIYYKLSTMYDKLVSLKNGGAQPNLNAAIIKNLKFPAPPIDIQKQIADILSAYDDLIENNQKQIKLLEEAAQRLYKEWFVDLRFPGYENTPIFDGVPQGWSNGTLDEVANFKRGKTITKDQTCAGTIPVVAGGLEPAYYHSQANTLSPVITVSGSGANAGFTRMYHTPIWASDCSFVDSQNTRNIYFAYCMLKSKKDDIDALQKGAAQPHVYAKDINALGILVPDSNCLAKFERLVTPFFEKIKVLYKQIELSKESRDRLLPKLMSGELEV